MSDCYRGVRSKNGAREIFCPCGRFMHRQSNKRRSWGDKSGRSYALAFELLYCHLDSHRRAMELCAEFLRRVVSKFNKDEWMFTAVQMDTVVAEIEAETEADNEWRRGM